VRLKGKVAVITGAASGIGLGAVERFVAEGARVLACDINETAGRALADRFPDEVAFQRCDVMQEADIEAAMAAAAQRFGGLDILFNNAGAGGSPQTIHEMTGEAWDFSQNLLLRSVALGIRYAIPHMIARRGGSIINTASIAGLQAGFGPIAYSVAKAGVVHLTKVAAAQVARDNIRVNAICPGLILTNIFTASPDMPEALRTLVRQNMAQTAADAQAVPKQGLPADIAAACLFLASDESAFVTGVALPVDGGMTMGPRHAWDRELQAERARTAEERRIRALAEAPETD
jgi:NAD(P)-dependent dehydrogenase (short-subunit alcohol dehydrogenase family)